VGAYGIVVLGVSLALGALNVALGKRHGDSPDEARSRRRSLRYAVLASIPGAVQGLGRFERGLALALQLSAAVPIVFGVARGLKEAWARRLGGPG
jgi:hypothetical protein